MSDSPHIIIESDDYIISESGRSLVVEESEGMVDFVLRVCPFCKSAYMEDDRMYEEPERCPRCGAYPDDADNNITDDEPDIDLF